MFPNVRLMIAATFVSAVVLICGFVVFAAFRVTHEPLGRVALVGPLQLTAEGIEPAPGESTAPFMLRFAAEQRPAVRDPFNLPMLQLSGSNQPVAWPAAAPEAHVSLSPSDADEPTAPAAHTEPVGSPVAELPPETDVSPPDAGSAPAEIAVAGVADTAGPAPAEQLAAAPEPTPPESTTVPALAPETAIPAPSPLAAALQPQAPAAQIPTTPEPSAAEESAPSQVATAGDTVGAVTAPIPAPAAEPAFDAVAALVPAEAPAIELETDQPAITGKVPLPRAAPTTRTERPAGAQAPRTAKMHRARKAHSRAFAFGNGLDPFATSSAFQTQFRNQNPVSIGGPYVGPTGWGR